MALIEISSINTIYYTTVNKRIFQRYKILKMKVKKENTEKMEKNKKIVLTKFRKNVNITNVNVTRTLATE